jgi:hypothetical protein
MEESGMSALEALASDVAGKIGEQSDAPQGYKIDPAIIQLLLELFKTMLPILLEKCNKNPERVRHDCEGILNPMRAPLQSILHRRWLRRQVQEVFGRRALREFGNSIENSCCQIGVGITDEALLAAYGEC